MQQGFTYAPWSFPDKEWNCYADPYPRALATTRPALSVIFARSVVSPC
jgi:hypothetical protein